MYMGKNSLIGGSLWEQYSNKVNQRMEQPLFRGEITEAEAAKLGGKLIVADWGAESCGDTVRLYWVVDESTHKILASRFKSFGCGTAIASSDVMAELCIGKTVDEALGITNIDVEFAMRDNPETPAVPPQKMHCSVMAYDVIKQAAALYKGVDISTLEDEEMVCECARVTLSTIKEVIKLNDLKTVEEITAYTKAGAFCKSCVKPGGHEKKKYYLVDILRDTRLEMEKELASASLASTQEEISFQAMTLAQKLRSIEQCLDNNVRPHLVRDGGGVELLELTQEADEFKLYLRYQGACLTCAGSVGTLLFIQEQLQQNIDKKIVVYSV